MNKRVLKWNFVFQYGYVLTNIINSLILLPFYLHKIDTAVLGMWLATGNILAWMTLIDPGVGDVLQQKIAALHGKGETVEIGRTIGSGLIAAGGFLLLAMAAGLVFYFLAGSIVNKDLSIYTHLQTALLITVLSTGFSIISFSFSGINQGVQNAFPVAMSAILANVLFLVINITLLFLGFGILSIAAANCCRALFINIYNLSALRSFLRKSNIQVIFDRVHLKGFVKIFSFTSLASIIGGLSASMDTIVLARFIPPFMITLFEVNKRPVQLTQSLVGRHSVALMPVVSHASGKQDHHTIVRLISTQFRYYSYVVLFLAALFLLVYRDVISIWAGADKYIGITILGLLVANFGFNLVGYFMANVGYAIGDIKRNSIVNVIKGIGTGVLFYPAAQHFGIIGVLAVMLLGNVVIEFCYFPYRLYQLGFLTPAFIKSTLARWAMLIPAVALTFGGIAYLVAHSTHAGQHWLRLVLEGTAAMVIFGLIVFWTDERLRNDLLTKTNTIKFKFLKQSNIY